MAKRKQTDNRANIIGMLARELAAHEARRTEADLEISRLQGAIRALGGGKINGKAHKTVAAETSARGGKRKRRSSAYLAKLASKVHLFIKTAGDKGIGGGDIQRKFGKLIPTPSKFLEGHGHKVKTSGAKSKMRYHV